jgi:pyridoxine 5-phosphate synthase
MEPIRLGVNIDHVATLRQVRLARYPDIVEAMHLCERGGADQITVHLREDRRHIQDQDVSRLLECSLLPINLEMAFVPQMIEAALSWKPYSVTLVPERREEMTTESGLNLEILEKNMSALEALRKDLRVVGFIDPQEDQVRAAAKLGLDAIEFHTGPYSHAFEEALRSRNDQKLRDEYEKLQKAAVLCGELGLEVRAGHGLTVQNVKALKKLPGICEFNIGHSIVARAILMGLEAATREMRQALDS